jgi:acyl-ACP thioesterase
MNKYGEASPAIMLALLEEAAAEHCQSINYGLYDLLKQNIGWVLVSGVMKMKRYPNYKEKIVIKTWLSGYTNVKGFRENIICDEQGRIIGRSRGLWMFFDINRRRPARIFDDIKVKWSFSPEKAMKYSLDNVIDTISSAEYVNEIRVRQSEIDIYQHANNLRYLLWLLDSVPEDVVDRNYLSFIDGRFISEIHGRQEIIMLTTPDKVSNEFIHTIKLKGTDKICATAITIWKKRKNGFQSPVTIPSTTPAK